MKGDGHTTIVHCFLVKEPKEEEDNVVTTLFKFSCADGDDDG